MTLHWQRTKRARGLAMPLPPKPKRPQRPPALFNWNGIDVRKRSDIEAAGYTWDEFLDSYAAEDDLRHVMFVDVLQLVPPGERQDLQHDIRRWRRDHHERQAAREAEHRKRLDEIAASRSWIPEFLRRA